MLSGNEELIQWAKENGCPCKSIDWTKNQASPAVVVPSYTQKYLLQKKKKA